MADILFRFEAIAATPSAIALTKNMVIAMSTIQSEIEKATTQNNWILAGYILALVIAAAMTLLSWRAGNRVQDLVRKDADARIAEADGKAAVANENAGKANERAGIANEAAAKANDSAATANERAQKLESDNLELRTDLERATAEARNRQAELAREQTKLASEQRKTAEAQQEAAEAQLKLKKYLEEVAARQADRKLSKGFRRVGEIVVDKLDRGNLWPVRVQYKDGDDEAFRFAQKINMSLRNAGWYCMDDEARPITRDESIDGMMRSWFPSVRPGITIVFPARSNKFKLKMVSVLEEDFTASGFPPYVTPGRSDSTEYAVIVIVGSKISY